MACAESVPNQEGKTEYVWVIKSTEPGAHCWISDDDSHQSYSAGYQIFMIDGLRYHLGTCSFYSFKVEKRYAESYCPGI